MNLNHWALLSVFSVNTSLASLAYFKNRHNIVNKTFAFFTASLGLWSASLVFLQLTQSLFWSDAVMFFGILMGLGFLLFVEVFPNGTHFPKILTAFLVLAALLMIFLLPFGLLIKGVVIKNGRLQPILGPLYPLFTIYVFGTASLGFIKLFIKYRKLWGLAKYQLKYLLWGLAIFSAGALLTNVFLPNFGIYNLAFLGPVFSIVFALTVFYAIVRHRLMEIQLVLGRGVISLLTLTVTALFPVVLVLSLNEKFLVPWGVPRYVAALVAAIFFVSTHDRVEKFFEARLTKYLAKKFLTFNELLQEVQTVFREEIRLEKLVARLAQLLAEVFSPQWQCFFIFTTDKEKKIRLFRVYNFGQNFALPNFPASFFDELKQLRRTKLFTINEALQEKGEKSVIAQVLKNIGAEICAPLVSRDRLVGLLFMGSRQNRKAYSKQDLDTLQVVINQAAISIDNARLYQESQDFNLTLQKEIEKATADLRKANEDLKRLDRMKDELVSIASHELRTPMTAIKSYLYMVLYKEQEGLNEKILDYLQKAYDSSERMLRLINDMLSVSRLDSGRMKVDLKVVEIVEVIKGVLSDLKIKAEEKEVELKYEGGVEVKVWADRDRITEVLMNLVGNAIKFSFPGGEVKVRVEEGEEVRVEIIDDGPGIPAEDIPRLFRKFSRLQHSFATMAERQGGTGLGLYISKGIVELHGGRIWAESPVYGEGGEGRGTKFVFTLRPARKK